MRPVLPADAQLDAADLTPLARAVAALADGSREVAAIALECGVGREAVFAALDELADAGLLTERVAPPAGPARRTVLRAGVVGVGVAAAGVLSTARAAAFPGSQDPPSEQDLKNEEVDEKQHQEKRKDHQEKQDKKHPDQEEKLKG